MNEIRLHIFRLLQTFLAESLFHTVFYTYFSDNACYIHRNVSSIVLFLQFTITALNLVLLSSSCNFSNSSEHRLSTWKMQVNEFMLSRFRDSVHRTTSAAGWWEGKLSTWLRTTKNLWWRSSSVCTTRRATVKTTGATPSTSHGDSPWDLGQQTPSSLQKRLPSFILLLLIKAVVHGLDGWLNLCLVHPSLHRKLMKIMKEFRNTLNCINVC